MYRLIVALLAALDALIQAAVGLAVVAAPLTVLWVFGLGDAADWGTLWPTTAKIWQLGNLVPLTITLPEQLIVAGIPAEAATFGLSLAPLAFAAFTVIFGFRSGSRATRAGTWPVATFVALLVAGAASALIALTSTLAVAGTELWQAIAIPAVLYGAAVLLGGLVTAWRHGDGGLVDEFRDRLDAARLPWAEITGSAFRGAAIALAAIAGVASLALAGGFIARGAQVIALFQAGNTDALGATIVMLAQLAYLPTLVVWAMSWIAGPGFALGTATAVSPAGTDISVIPGIPVLGVIPEVQSPWFLLVLLLPIAAGVVAGWSARAALAATSGPHTIEPVLPRLISAFGIAVLAGAGAALLALAASGSFGPGRFAHVGPHAGQVALAVGIEVLVGAAILLLLPRRSEDEELPTAVDPAESAESAESTETARSGS